MALAAGTRLGAYEILGLLGAGGMGEVYRARDTRLHREVAIKVLLTDVANDADRLARFSREAQLLAALNHPNIAHIHGVEDTDAAAAAAPGRRALVMELVEGPTLADRITRGAIAMDEALPIAQQIAEALEAAHAQGIIHRDLKPANIKVRADGTVKVLDFGLAKALAAVGVSSTDATISAAPAIHATQAGLILGTAAYMAPEQARGQTVDTRADIWAFGCVLFEMLTSTRAFRGDGVTDTMVAILSREPDWQALPAGAARVRALIARCLRKDPRQRLQAIGDARIQIDELIADSPGDAGTTGPPAPRRRRLDPASIAALAATALVAALVTWVVARPAPSPSPPPQRFQVVPPPSQSVAIQGSDRNIAISPDGQFLVYRAGGGLDRLIVRAIGRLDAHPLEGVTNVRQPFISADSKWVGYFDGSSLKKVSIAGGPPITILKTTLLRGASWAEDNTIVFATTDTSTGLLRVPASGGEPTVLTRPDPSTGETNHWYPSMLPGGRGVLFTITGPNQGERAQVAVLDLRSGRRQSLLRGSQAEYVGSGHLLYAVAGSLFAVRFDLDRLAVLGDPVPVVDGVWMAPGGAANYSISRAGTLIYVPSGSAERSASLVWVDRKGNQRAIPTPARAYFEPRLSPDGSRAALSIRDQDNDIWIWDSAREDQLRRLTFGPSLDQRPVWTADGQRIVYSSMREDVFNLFVQAADGTGAVERLTSSPYAQAPGFVAPDGTGILGTEQPPTTAGDIVWFPLKPGSAGAPASGSHWATAEPLIRTPAIEYNPALSPDGRYLAYQSNESGAFQIYVRPFPRVNNGLWLVSTSGGTRPMWARNGRELFYLDLANVLTAVPVQTSGGTFASGNPNRVLETPFAQPLDNSRPYDVHPDGQQFLMIKENPRDNRNPATTNIVFILNFFEELRARLATK